MPCLPAPQDEVHCTAGQGITNTSQVICSGNTSAYLPCPGAVAIASVPPPVRPQEMGKGVKVSPHWLPRLGMETERKQNPVHSTRCPIVYPNIQRLAGSAHVSGKRQKRKNTGLLLVIGRYTPITTVTFGTAQIERFSPHGPMGPYPPSNHILSISSPRLPGRKITLTIATLHSMIPFSPQQPA